MSTGMLGMDPQDCRDLVKVLKNSAQQLEHASSQLSQAVARAGWQGPDSQQFRAQWPANRTRISHTVTDLEDTATQLLQQIAEQERASAADDGGGGGGGGGGLWDDLTDAMDHAVDTVKDGPGWLGDLLGDRMQTVNTFFDNLGHLGKMGWDLLSGNPPSLSGLVAQLVLTSGSLQSLTIMSSTLGLVNPQLFDDGQPYAGEPQAVTNGSANPVQVPGSIAEIFGSVEDAYAMGHEPGTEDGDVRIVKVEQPDGSFSYIVNIPGTENWLPNGSGQGRDLTSNLMVMAGNSSSAQEAIELAMEKAGIPPDAPVMLAGHSQGGMLAMALAADPEFMSQYSVTNVLTAGSPVDGVDVPAGVNVLEIQHAGDLVPKLDLGGLNTDLQLPDKPSNVSVVTMDDPPRDMLGNVLHYTPTGSGNMIQDVRDIATNHATDHYKDGMSNTSKYPEISAYEQDPSMRVFLSSDRDKVTAVDVPVGRR